ncbi:hypothetical protein T05_59 [Trichinella murrelli]|uniref:Reverse transcriptase/retrotransposon-derived protein RNase H-like domain-containing protein n=1 Tax=Trichinella murrelli TaxID=144512 RepID=A0A0V0TEU7_9BILA|nr:hypothetical protein T05_59 [Trichinella murrelli]
MGADFLYHHHVMAVGIKRSRLIMAPNNAPASSINCALAIQSTDKYQSLLARFYPYEKDITQAAVKQLESNIISHAIEAARSLQAPTVNATEATGSQRSIWARHNTAVQQLLGVATAHGTCNVSDNLTLQYPSVKPHSGDCCSLNCCTTPDRYPLPHLADLAHSYYHIPVQLQRPSDDFNSRWCTTSTHPTAEYALMVDASDHTIGTVFQQPVKNSWQPLAFSRRLSLTQKILTHLQMQIMRSNTFVTRGSFWSAPTMHSVKEDLNCSAAEMWDGSVLRLPVDFFMGDASTCAAT